MGNVTTVKGSLFDAPTGSIIIHACNTKGVWGAGIAREFAKRYPKARDIYAQHCREYGHTLVGTSLLIPVPGYVVGCLFTSKSYGQYADSPDKILKATKSALMDVIIKNKHKLPMHMCKINSGLFGVKWSLTKEILKELGQEFTVYDF